MSTEPSGGVIAGGSPVTVAAGVEILRMGGNAADAALAAATTALHAEGTFTSAGGGGLMMAGNPGSGFSVLDFTPIVPGRGLTARPKLDFIGVPISFGCADQTFHVGRGAAGVPTFFAGLTEAHRRWGSLPLRTIVAPAIRACREGVVVTEALTRIIGILEPVWTLSSECAALYQIDGRRVRPGDPLRNPDFADVLERFADEGPDFIYKGEIAERIVDAFGPFAGGLITGEDLARYQPRLYDPIELSVAGGRLLTPPPPSLGGGLIALGLGVLCRQPLDAVDFLSPRHLKLVTAVQLLLLAVRRDFLSGGAPNDVVIRGLLSDEGLVEQASRLETIESFESHQPDGRGSTTHVSVIDARGGAAAITVSHGEGCGHVIPGTGIQLNNFLGEEDINPDGFHRQSAGESMATMMAPTIFLRGGRPVLVLGSGGSNRLRTAIMQVAYNRVGLKQKIETAVSAPRIHVESDRFSAESPGVDPGTLNELRRRFSDSDIFPEKHLYFGGVHSVGVEPNGRMIGAGDARRGGVAVIVGPSD